MALVGAKLWPDVEAGGGGLNGLIGVIIMSRSPIRTP